MSTKFTQPGLIKLGELFFIFTKTHGSLLIQNSTLMFKNVHESKKFNEKTCLSNEISWLWRDAKIYLVLKNSLLGRSIQPRSILSRKIVWSKHTIGIQNQTGQLKTLRSKIRNCVVILVRKRAKTHVLGNVSPTFDEQKVAVLLITCFRFSLSSEYIFPWQETWQSSGKADASHNKTLFRASRLFSKGV